MASKRRASYVPRDFTTLIFSDGYLTLPLCVPVYNQLERDPSQVSYLLADEDLLLKFLSNFDLYASRISQFFRQLSANLVNSSSQKSRRKSCVGPGLADELVESLLIPLLGDDFQQFQLRSGFHDLFASVVNFCLPFRPRPLEELARRLGEKDKLLEALVSGETSSQVMKEWIQVFNVTLFDPKIFGVWARRLVSQCRRCDNSHGVSEQTQIWQKLDGLIGSLTNIIPTSSEGSQALPSLRNLRKLTDTDKKSGATSGSQKSSFELPSDVCTALLYFQIQPPKSERTLQNALEKLQTDETLKVLQGVVGSFPCRPCYNSSTTARPSATKSYDRYDEENWESSVAKPIRGSLLFTELLGRGLGIWRVFLSSQALKDLEEAQFEGIFPSQLRVDSAGRAYTNIELNRKLQAN